MKLKQAAIHSISASVNEEKKKLKPIDLTKFVRNQFRQLERRNLQIPVQLFQL